MPVTRLQGLFLVHLSESTPQHGAVLLLYYQSCPRITCIPLYTVLSRSAGLTVSPISLFEQVISRLYCGVFRTRFLFFFWKISCRKHYIISHAPDKFCCPHDIIYPSPPQKIAWTKYTIVRSWLHCLYFKIRSKWWHVYYIIIQVYIDSGAYRWYDSSIVRQFDNLIKIGKHLTKIASTVKNICAVSFPKFPYSNWQKIVETIHYIHVANILPIGLSSSRTSDRIPMYMIDEFEFYAVSAISNGGHHVQELG